MSVYDEKDYIMRIIKEAVQVMFSLMFGKQYTTLELETENKYQVSGKNLEDFQAMADDGDINEAENLLLSQIDYSRKEDVAAAALFYQYLSEKDESFLREHQYSREEVLDGMQQLVKKSGHEKILDLF